MDAGIPIQVTRTEQMTVCVTADELAHAIKHFVWLKLGKPDDAGVDWLTNGNDIYFGGRDWLVSEDADLALLVDAANLLAHGEVMHV